MSTTMTEPKSSASATGAAPMEPTAAMLLGVPFHDVTMVETLDHLDTLVARRRPGYLATANLDFAEQANRDVELQRILLEAQLVLCDGTPLVWASRWLDAPLRERVAGSDLMPHLFQRAAEKGHRLFFLGASEDTLNVAVEKCVAQYPGLVISGRYAPPYARLLEINHDEIVRQVQAAAPDILLVALGCPKQEKWIFMHYRELGVPVSIGIGASLDFIAGKFKRAPLWMRACGGEWIVRLLQEPRRLASRYAADLLFFRRAYRQQKALLAAGSSGSASSAAVPAPESTSRRRYVEWGGEINRQTAVLKAEPGQTVVILGSGVTGITAHGLGVLSTSWRLCKEAGGALVILQPSPLFRDALGLTHLDSQMPVVASEAEIARFEAAAPGVPVEDRAAVRAEAAVLALELSGELTAATVPEYEAFLAEAWHQSPGAQRLELDLAKVTFMDSSGLGLLLKILKLTRQRPGGALAVREPSANVLNVIRLANLGAALGVAKTR